MASRGANLQINELVELVRGLCGGFLFSIPILYTMEMWWLGYSMETWKVLAFFVAGYGFAVALNFISGFLEDFSAWEVFTDAVIAMAMGLVVAAVMLYVLGEWSVHGSLPTFLRQCLILAVPLSIGISLSRSQLGEQGAQPERAGQPGEDRVRRRISADLRDMGMVVVGGVFIGLSAAPTEEITQIAHRAGFWQYVAMVGLSVGLSYAILFQARFTGQSRRYASEGFLQHPWRETWVAYGLSLMVSALLLWFLGSLPGPDVVLDSLGMVVALALPVSLGGAAARLIL